MVTPWDRWVRSAAKDSFKFSIEIFDRMKYRIHSNAIYKVLKQVSPEMTCYHVEIMQEHLSFIFECYCVLLDQELKKHGGQLSYKFLCEHPIVDGFSKNEGTKAVTKYRDNSKPEVLHSLRFQLISEWKSQIGCFARSWRVQIFWMGTVKKLSSRTSVFCN